MFTVYVSRGRGGCKVSTPESFDSVGALKAALIAEGYKSYRFTKPNPFDSADDIYRSGEIEAMVEEDVEFCLDAGCDIMAFAN